jgi:mycoredoxin
MPDCQPGGLACAFRSDRPSAVAADPPQNPGMSVTHPTPNPTTITVYGADWCGDCRRSKRLLTAREAEFVWVDVNADRAIRDELTGNGYPAIPVIVLPGGLVLMEPSDEELGSALDAVAVAR